MSARPGFDLRLYLIYVTGTLNLALGGLLLAFGVWIMVAGGEAVAALFQAQGELSRAAQEVPLANAPAAQKAGDLMKLASQGLAGIILALAGVVAGCSIVQGLPLVLVGAGVLSRQSWARVLTLLLAVLALLEGLACVLGTGQPRSVLVTGGLLLGYGVLSFVALLGRRASDYFARRDLEPGSDGKPIPSSGRPLLVGGAVALLVVVGISLAFWNANRPATLAGSSVKDADRRVQGAWRSEGTIEPHSIAFRPGGGFLYSTEKGTAKGTYRLLDDGTAEIAYEVPDELLAAQKFAFAAAKKTFDALPNNPLKGTFTMPEPVRSVKDRARVTPKGDGLTVRWAKREVTYRKTIDNLGPLELTKLPPPDAGKKPDPQGIAKKSPNVDGPDDSLARYKARLAALNDAIERGQSSRVQELLKAGASPNDRDDKGETPLMKTVQSGYGNIVKLLIDKGADSLVADREGNDLFLYAAARGKLAWLFRAINGGQAPSSGWSFTYSAGKRGSVMEFLGGDTNHKGMTAAMFAAAGGHLEDLSILHVHWKGSGGNFKDWLVRKDHSGKTALDHATEKKHRDVIAFLAPLMGKKVETAKLPPEVKKETKGGKEKPPARKLDDLISAFFKALKAGNAEAVDEALKSGKIQYTTSGPRDEQGKTPLMHAAERGDITLVLLLGQYLRGRRLFGDLHSRDDRGRTALHYAAVAGKTEALERLLDMTQAGWRLHQGPNDATSVHWFLCVEQRDADGKTALDLAKSWGHNEAATALAQFRDKMFHVVCAVKDGSSALTAIETACWRGDWTIVRGLLKAGCPVQRPNVKYSIGNLKSPLMLAASGGHLLVVQDLLDSFGKDAAKKAEYVNLRAGNMTALERANAYPEVLALLRKHGAK